MKCGGQQVRLGLTVLLTVCLTGCSCSRREPDVGPGAADPQRAAQRVVCGSPAVTEIVYALGGGERVVGVSDYTTYPPEAAQKPRIGGRLNPSRERLLVLDPDLIVTQGRHESLAAFAAQYGIRFRGIKLDSLDDIFAAVRAVAAALDVEQAGEALTERLRTALARIEEASAGRDPTRMVLIVGRTPGDLRGLTTVGPGTFLHDLVRMAGGTNVFADTRGAYPRISKEALIARQPELIVELSPGLPEGQGVALLADWRKVGALAAVEKRNVHVLTQDFLLIPGPRVVSTARELSALVSGQGL